MTPAFTATTPVSIPRRSKPITQRLGAPDTPMIAITAAEIIKASPRSGSRMISNIGTRATARAFTTSKFDGAESLSRASASNIAIPIITEIFASSAGCNVKPPGNEIHERAPLIVLPMPGMSTATNPKTPTPQTNGVYARSNR